MIGEDQDSADDSMSNPGEQQEEYEYTFYKDYDSSWNFHFNSDMLDYRSSNLFFNSELQKSDNASDLDFKEWDKWAKAAKAMHTSAEASNSLFSTSIFIGNADKSYRSIPLKRSFFKSEEFGKKLEGISLGLDTYEYFEATYSGEYAKAFSTSSNILLGVIVGVVTKRFKWAAPVRFGVVKLLDYYKPGEFIYEGINTLFNEGYSPEPGAFWL